MMPEKTIVYLVIEEDHDHIDGHCHHEIIGGFFTQEEALAKCAEMEQKQKARHALTNKLRQAKNSFDEETNRFFLCQLKSEQIVISILPLNLVNNP